MVNGLNFDIASTELHAHLLKRVEHHRKRVAFYEDKASGLEDGGAEAATYSGGDPVRALRDKASQHQGRLELFEFMANHVVPDETYRLEESDLRTLEIISRHF